MAPPSKQSAEETRPFTYPLGGLHATPKEEELMSLLALTHTRVEQGLYEAMFAETRSKESRAASFSIRRLMELTGLTSYSTVRRTLRGLLRKLSIESGENGSAAKQGGTTFRVYAPEEIFSRRNAAGRDPYPEDV